MKKRFWLGLVLGLVIAGLSTFGWQEWRLIQQRELGEQQIIKLNQQIEKLTKDVESLRSQNTSTQQPPKDNINLKEVILQRGKEVLTSIKNNDMDKLASYVHPDKGVRFSPYSHVDSKKDIVFKPKQVKDISLSQEDHLWGNYDGSGDPIQLTAKEYFKKFVYDQDFLNAKQIHDQWKI